jgi:adenosylcobinamide-GDP ribazoletransferase
VVLTALRGAVAFLTRLPVGTDERAWDAFRQRPSAFPLAGYPVGLLVGLPLLAPLPAPTVAALYVGVLYLVTGVTHADGLADLGDAFAVHGAPDERRAAMTDTTVGVGAALALGVALLGLALGALALAHVPPPQVLGLALAAEVSAKLSMATLAGLGEPSHEGLGAQVLGAGPRAVALALAVAVPAALFGWPTPAGLAAVAAGPLVAVGLLWWARANLGGPSGDVLGASNELARVVALHAGVVVWTRF